MYTIMHSVRNDRLRLQTVMYTGTNTAFIYLFVYGNVSAENSSHDLYGLNSTYITKIMHHLS